MPEETTIDTTKRVPVKDILRTPLPELKEELPDSADASMLPINQREIMKLAGPDDGSQFPKISEVKALMRAKKMPLPPEFLKQYPERCYYWGSKHVYKDLHYSTGGSWDVVTKGNHPRVSSKLFNAAGYVEYHGESLLMWSQRALHEAVEEEHVSRFNRKADNATNPNEKKFGDKEQVIVEPTQDKGKPGFDLDEKPPDFG